MNILRDKITKSHEIWDCYDPRLPLDKDLTGTPPDDGMLESIQQIQLQEILVVKKGKEYIFRFGNRRLRAIRMNHALGRPPGVVEVVVVEGVDPEDWNMLTLIENEQRSPNEMSAYEILHDMVQKRMKSGGDLGTVYKEVAKLTGYTAGQVKAIDNKWCKVPLWAVNAAGQGKIAPNTAIELGKLSPELQKECKADFQKNKKLTAGDVKAKRQVRQAVQYQNIMVDIGQQPRQMFMRDELEELFQLDTWDAMYNALKALLAQTE